MKAPDPRPIKRRAERPDYGVDAPYVIRNLVMVGLGCLVVALLAHPLRWLYSWAISFLATAAVWLYGSKWGKLRLREQLMDTLRWRGDETVLDVGCGSGLLLIAAAKRARQGQAADVDIWRREDLSNSGREATLRNAALEGVVERVRVEEGDARALPFGDAGFDVIVSLNALHNIPQPEGREQALREAVRALKPGGRLAIADFRNTREYARFLRGQGMTNACRQRIGWVGLYPVFAAVGAKSPE
jgi:arsenite methyltransferase